MNKAWDFKQQAARAKSAARKFTDSYSTKDCKQRHRFVRGFCNLPRDEMVSLFIHENERSMPQGKQCVSYFILLSLVVMMK
jgi:hypothetical protein